MRCGRSLGSTAWPSTFTSQTSTIHLSCSGSLIARPNTTPVALGPAIGMCTATDVGSSSPSQFHPYMQTQKAICRHGCEVRLAEAQKPSRTTESGSPNVAFTSLDFITMSIIACPTQNECNNNNNFANVNSPFEAVTCTQKSHTTHLTARGPHDCQFEHIVADETKSS